MNLSDELTMIRIRELMRNADDCSRFIENGWEDAAALAAKLAAGWAFSLMPSLRAEGGAA